MTNYAQEDIDAQLPDLVRSLSTEVVERLGSTRIGNALAARLNLWAFFKRLLHLPTSPRLQNRKNIIDTVFSINTCNDDGATALHIAVMSGNHKVARALLRLPASDALVEEEFDCHAATEARNSRRVPLLAECAAHGGDTELARLFAQRAKDPRLRMLCAGLVGVSGTVTIDAEEREEAGGREAAKPLLITFKEACTLQGVFPCQGGQQCYFEVEIEKAGGVGDLSFGFVSEEWDGCGIEDGEFNSGWGVAGRALKDGDVLGLGLDRERGRIFVSVNGKLEREKGTNIPEDLQSESRIWPVVTGRKSSLRINWGGSARFSFPLPCFPSFLSHARCLQPGRPRSTQLQAFLKTSH